MCSKKSNPTLDNDDIEIRVVTEDDRPQVLDLLHKYFFLGEPLNAFTEPKGHIQKEEEDFIMSKIEHGNCFIAIHKPTNKSVGVCIAGPQGVDEANHLFEEAAKIKGTKWGHVLHLMGCIERDAQVAKRYNVEKSMYIIATCVDTTMRGKRIGARLYNAVRDLAKASGYGLLRADCSSYYSARIKEELGWDCINTVYYKDHVDENNKPIFVTHPPHECCKSYAIRL